MIHKDVLISVILTTYNENERFLIQCIDSILQQTFGKFELIIILEPGDINYDFLKRQAKLDNRIILIKNKTKLGFVKSLNVALSNCKGKYIARIDSDDFCELERFQKQIEYFSQNQKIDVLGTDLNLINKTDYIIGGRHYQSKHDKIKKSFAFTSSMAHPSVMIRKKCFDLHGKYDENFIFSEDLELWLRLLSKGCVFHNLNTKLVNYRVADIKENRFKYHWKYNLMARKKYSFTLWNPILASISIATAFILSNIPLFIMTLINSTRLADLIKGKNKV